MRDGGLVRDGTRAATARLTRTVRRTRPTIGYYRGVARWVALWLVAFAGCDRDDGLPGPGGGDLVGLADRAILADASRAVDAAVPDLSVIDATVVDMASVDLVGCFGPAPGFWPACPQAPTLVATSCGTPTALAVDDGALYWTDPAAESVVRMAKGGAPQPLAPVAGDAALAWDLVLEADTVYFTEAGTGKFQVGTPGAVWKVAKAGGPATRLAWCNPTSKASMNQFIGHPSRIAVDGTNVYWTENRGELTFDTPQPGYVGSVPEAGGPQSTIADAVLAPFAIVADDQWLYFCGEHNSGIARAGKNGGWNIYDTLDEVGSRLAVDETNLYFGTCKFTGNLYVIPKAMSVDLPMTVVFSAFGLGEDRIDDIVLDDDHLYWSSGKVMDATKGHIFAMRKDGVGGVINLAAEPGPRLAVDGDSLYWTTTNGVMRICK